MQFTVTRIANTSNFTVTVTGPNNLHIQFQVTAVQLKAVVVALQQSTPPNMQEQGPINAWLLKVQ